MFRKLKICLAGAVLALTLSAAAVAQLPTVMDEKDILPYLDQMIDWHRRALALEVPAELPRLLLVRTSLDQHALKALNASFDLAHALAGIDKDAALPPPPPAVPVPGAPPVHNIKNAIRKEEQRVHDLQASLQSAHDGSAHTSLDGQLKLAQEHLNLLKTIAASIGDTSDANDTLEDKIGKLEETIPEANSARQGEGAPPAATAPVLTGSMASGSGMAGLVTDLMDYVKARQQVKALRNETAAMLDEGHARGQAIRTAMQDIMKQGTDIGAIKKGAEIGAIKKGAGLDAAEKPSANGKPGAEDAKAPGAAAAKPAGAVPGAAAAPPPTYDELLTEMKALTKAALPLSVLNRSLDASVNDLTQWADAFAQQIHDISRRLLVRLGIMASVVLGLCLLSVLFNRATSRYVLDDRRKVQLRTVRKMVLVSSITLVVFLGFFTDFSSLATFAGLLTAGLAVALQTVLLSLVAFFHFFGSFGIRVGDRITISGVTGRVMQIGMVRFYLMELVKSDVGYLPTGRIVGFSNSILFQPLPFFRQTPGTNFVWSEISLTLDPTVDYEMVHKRLRAVVQGVYAKQRDIIRRQELALQNITHFKAEVSEPQMYLKITGAGLVLTIRYAVQREQEAELHLQMTEELLSVIKKDPELRFANIG